MTINLRSHKVNGETKRVLRQNVKPYVEIYSVNIRRGNGNRSIETSALAYSGHTAIHLKDLRKAGVFNLPQEISYSADAFRNGGVKPETWVFPKNETAMLHDKIVEKNLNALAVISSNTGNVPLHEWEIVYVRRAHRSNDLLLARDFEAAGKPIKDREYFCVRYWKSGIIDIGPVWFHENGRPKDPYLMMAVGGRPLIRGGKRIPMDEILEKCVSDPRHVIKLPEVELSDGTFMPLGLRTIQAAIKTGKAQDIIDSINNGKPITIRLEDEKACIGEVTKEQIRKAIMMFGYGKLGADDFSFDPASGTIRIKLQYNPYRHSFWGRNGDEMYVGFVGNDVKDNKAEKRSAGMFGRKFETEQPALNPKFYGRVIKPTGMTIPELQDYLRDSLRMEDAVLMGDGRDSRVITQEYFDESPVRHADVDARDSVTGGIVSLILKNPDEQREAS